MEKNRKPLIFVGAATFEKAISYVFAEPLILNEET
jgi:hypothetical protein